MGDAPPHMVKHVFPEAWLVSSCFELKAGAAEGKI